MKKGKKDNDDEFNYTNRQERPIKDSIFSDGVNVLYKNNVVCDILHKERALENGLQLSFTQIITANDIEISNISESKSLFEFP